MKKITVCRIILWFLVLCMMSLIFYLSAQSADTSAKTSGSLIEDVINIIDPTFKEKQTQEKNEVIASYQKLVRKTAHFAEYALLGFLIMLPLKAQLRISFTVEGTSYVSDLFAV